jgi:cytoskeletal protein RodZ
LLGLSLDDVERHTHLRQRYLRALEAGDLDALPSPVQGRGMLHNYAAFLGLDPEPLLLRFADGLQARLVARRTARALARPAPARRSPVLPAPLRRLLSGDVLIGGALAVFLVAFVLWSAIRIFAMGSQGSPTPTAPSIAEVLLASPTATNSPTPLPPTPTSLSPGSIFPTQPLTTDAMSGGPFPPEAQGDVQVYITVRQRAWVRVVVDGEVGFEGRVLPGSAYTYSGDSQVEILTGNGAALHVFFNQQDMGQMGSFGQVVHRIFALQGVTAPTPTITPTATSTRPATATPVASPTPGPGVATAPSLP